MTYTQFSLRPLSEPFLSPINLKYMNYDYKKMEIVHLKIFIDSSRRSFSSITLIELLVVVSDTIFFASDKVSFGAKSKIGMR